MITQNNDSTQKIQALRNRLAQLINDYETVPGGRKHSKRARMVYVTNQLKALRMGVQS